MTYSYRISDSMPSTLSTLSTPALSRDGSRTATPNAIVQHSFASTNPFSGSPGSRWLSLNSLLAGAGDVAPDLDVGGRFEAAGDRPGMLLLQSTPAFAPRAPHGLQRTRTQRGSTASSVESSPGPRTPGSGTLQAFSAVATGDGQPAFRTLDPASSVEAFSRGGSPEPLEFEPAALGRLQSVVAPDNAVLLRERVHTLLYRLEPAFDARVAAQVESEKAMVYERLEAKLERLLEEREDGWLDDIKALKDEFATEETTIRERAVLAEARRVFAEHGHDPDLAELL